MCVVGDSRDRDLCVCVCLPVSVFVKEVAISARKINNPTSVLCLQDIKCMKHMNYYSGGGGERINSIYQVQSK